jgi:hypothetical protein
MKINIKVVPLSKNQVKNMLVDLLHQKKNL